MVIYRNYKEETFLNDCIDIFTAPMLENVRHAIQIVNFVDFQKDSASFVLVNVGLIINILTV